MSLARDVILAGAPRTVYVASGHPDAEDLALSLGAKVIRGNGLDLSADVDTAYRELSEIARRVTIVPADLAHPFGIGEWRPPRGVAIVPDRRGEGTNVLSLPTGLDFRFHYGSHSARRHQEEARRLRLPVSVIASSPWSWDVDEAFDIPHDARRAGN